MTVIFLNRWGRMFHVLVGSVEGDTHRRLQSGFCSTLEEARRVVARWQEEHGVRDENVQDNSAIDLDDLVSWMDFDLEDAADGLVAGAVH